MAGAGVSEYPPFGVNEDVSGSDVVSLKFSAESLIEASEHTCGIAGGGRLSRERNFQHGGDQCGGHAVARHIGDQNPGPVFIDNDEVIEVAGDGGHRYIAGGNIETGNLRNLARKDRKLDLPRGVEFAADVQKLSGQLLASFTKREMSVTPGRHNGGREGFMNVIHGSGLETLGFVFGLRLPGQEDDGNVLGVRTGPVAFADFVTMAVRHPD